MFGHVYAINILKMSDEYILEQLQLGTTLPYSSRVLSNKKICKKAVVHNRLRIDAIPERLQADHKFMMSLYKNIIRQDVYRIRELRFNLLPHSDQIKLALCVVKYCHYSVLREFSVDIIYHPIIIKKCFELHLKLLMCPEYYYVLSENVVADLFSISPIILKWLPPIGFELITRAILRVLPEWDSWHDGPCSDLFLKMKNIYKLIPNNLAETIITLLLPQNLRTNTPIQKTKPLTTHEQMRVLKKFVNDSAMRYAQHL